jgi:hypothetical protein
MHCADRSQCSGVFCATCAIKDATKAAMLRIHMQAAEHSSTTTGALALLPWSSCVQTVRIATASGSFVIVSCAKDCRSNTHIGAAHMNLQQSSSVVDCNFSMLAGVMLGANKVTVYRDTE